MREECADHKRKDHTQVNFTSHFQTRRDETHLQKTAPINALQCVRFKSEFLQKLCLRSCIMHLWNRKKQRMAIKKFVISIGRLLRGDEWNLFYGFMDEMHLKVLLALLAFMTNIIHEKSKTCRKENRH